MEQSTQRKTKSISPVAILKGIVTFIIVTMSLFHIFFDYQSKDQILHAPKYKLAVKERDSIQKHHLALLSNREITIEEYINLSTNLTKTSKSKLLALSAKRKELALAHSFRGRNSFHFWVFVFGLVTALLFFSCKSLYNDIKIGSTFRFQFVSISGILIGFFWLLHLVFLTQSDFTKNKYILLLFVCALFCSAFTYFLVKYYTYKDDIILKQLSFIERVRTIHYPNIALKALYSEKYSKAIISEDAVSASVNEFQKDLHKTMEDA